MGNQVGVEEHPEDWLCDEALEKNHQSNYPRSFKHYLHVWKCFPSPNNETSFRPVSILETLQSFSESEAYLILHVQFPKRSSRTKPTPSPGDKESIQAWHTLFSSLSSISPASFQDPLIANDNLQKIRSNTAPKYEIYVWNGLKASVVTQSEAIAKARKCNQILESASQTGFLKKITNSEFVPLACDLDPNNEIIQSFLKNNLLLKSLFEMTSSSTSTKSKAVRIEFAQEFRRAGPMKLPVTAATKKAAYAGFKKTQNAGIKSMGALKLEGISKTRAPDESRLKTEKLEKFSKVCSRIIPQLFLAGEAVASDRAQLKEMGITHILNCAGTYCPEYFPEDFHYKTLHLFDGKNEDISCFFFKVLEFITSAMSQNGSVLVHCQQGVSRSSAFVIMYLMWRNRTNFDETHAQVKRERGVSNPNTGFIFQLLLWEKRLGLKPHQNPYPWVVYIAPHSSNDPHELVLRTVEPKFTSFDPRGVFLVLQTRDSLFKWVGSLAVPEVVQQADVYIDYLFRFMDASNEYTVISEGEEPPSFCELLGGSPSPALEKSQYTPYFSLLDSSSNPISQDGESTSASGTLKTFSQNENSNTLETKSENQIQLLLKLPSLDENSRHSNDLSESSKLDGNLTSVQRENEFVDGSEQNSRSSLPDGGKGFISGVDCNPCHFDEPDAQKIAHTLSDESNHDDQREKSRAVDGDISSISL